MKISIESSKPITENYLIDLSENKIDFRLDESFSLQEGWYELNLPYTRQRTKIKDIKINDESIGKTLWSGVYIDTEGHKHQPAAYLWDEGGVFKIWIHTNLGVMLDRMFTEIDGHDLGEKNLEEKYLFTIDRPCVLKNIFPESIKSYFAHGDGPHWWKKDTDYTPYRILNINTPPVEKIIEEMDRISVREIKGVFGDLEIKTNSPGESDLPFLDMDWDKVPCMKEVLVDKVGFQNILSISLFTLQPHKNLILHRDDEHYNRKKYPIIRGCKKFYWPLTGDLANNYLKLGKAGMLPVKNKPYLINTLEHTHTAVNDSEEPRTVLAVYGDLPGKILGPGDQRDDK